MENTHRDETGETTESVRPAELAEVSGDGVVVPILEARSGEENATREKVEEGRERERRQKHKR